MLNRTARKRAGNRAVEATGVSWLSHIQRRKLRSRRRGRRAGVTSASLIRAPVCASRVASHAPTRPSPSDLMDAAPRGEADRRAHMRDRALRRFRTDTSDGSCRRYQRHWSARRHVRSSLARRSLVIPPLACAIHPFFPFLAPEPPREQDLIGTNGWAESDSPIRRRRGAGTRPLLPRLPARPRRDTDPM